MTMTMHSVYLKENGHGDNPSNGSSSWWSGLGTQQRTAYSESVCQRKSSSISSMEQQEQPSFKDQQQTTHQFTILPGDCKNSTEGQSFPQHHGAFSVQSGGPPEYRGCFELGFGQPMICAKYPYGDQCYGGVVFSTHGPEIMGRIMLPLSLTTDDGPIYVNAKQYHGIIRRRQSRAKAESEIKALRNSNRKPYLHLSRHLHAMRRPRGCGGRFLNTKKSEDRSKIGGPAASKKTTTGGRGVQLSQPTVSQNSEVLQSDNGNLTMSPRDLHGNSRLGGSEVTSMFSMRDLNQFPFNNLHHQQPSILSFSDIMNIGHVSSMVMPSKWVAAAISTDTCCNLKV